MTPDAKLVALARQARGEALALLYDAYRSKIYTFLLRLTGEDQAADDLTQDTFERAYRSLGQLQSESRVLPWLYRIASNAAIDAARRRRRIAWVPLLSLLGRHDEPRSADGGEGAVSDREQIQRILRVLPPENSVALLLHALEGYSYQEIAEIQGCSMTAVRSRIARARVAFRLAYSEREAQEGTGSQ